MSDPDIERIVEQAIAYTNGKTFELSVDGHNECLRVIARRAAELARDAEKEKTAAMLRLLIDAPHQEHFCTRLNDDEMKGIDAMKKWLAAYNHAAAIRAGKEVVSG